MHISVKLLFLNKLFSMDYDIMRWTCFFVGPEIRDKIQKALQKLKKK